jgi:hypothetical protein
VNSFDTDVVHNKPDMCFVDTQNKEAIIVEISHPFDSFLEVCYQNKFNKYLPLCTAIQAQLYKCTIVVLIVGSLGTVHHRFVPGLIKFGISKTVAKALAKFIGISAMIGSRRVWRCRRR